MIKEYCRKKALIWYIERLNKIIKRHKVVTTPTYMHRAKNYHEAYYLGETYYLLNDNKEIILEIYQW